MGPPRPFPNDIPGAVDVVVIGGGPAGASAARLLAIWGHQVVLLTRPGVQPALGESLPPSCDKLFDRIGIRHAIETAGFLQSTGNTVRWGSAEARVERFGGGRYGYQVSRDAFDRVLLDQAAAAGAVVRANVQVRDVWRDAAGAGVAMVAYDEGSQRREIAARWLLDCTGRAGLVGRQGMRRAEPGGRTMAIAGIWERAGDWPTVDQTHTLVESYEGGWAWSVPVLSHRRFVTAMVDPSLTAVANRQGLAATYHAELGRTIELRRLVEGARLVEPPFARDASSYNAVQAGANGLLLVGDAASFVDPLSSYGVKKALASAWLAAVVVHSCLSSPTVLEPALAFYESRERAMYDGLRARFTTLARDALTPADGEKTFWVDRADSEEGAGPDEPDIAALRSDPDVLHALQELKRRSSINLRETPTVRRVQKAIVRGNMIVLEEHLAASAFEHGIRFIRSVDLVTVAALARDHDQVPDLFDAYNRCAPPTSLPDFLGALSVLVAKGLLAFA